jgi:hypothetical protein
MTANLGRGAAGDWHRTLVLEERPLTQAEVEDGLQEVLAAQNQAALDELEPRLCEPFGQRLRAEQAQQAKSGASDGDQAPAEIQAAAPIETPAQATQPPPSPPVDLLVGGANWIASELEQKTAVLLTEWDEASLIAWREGLRDTHFCDEDLGRLYNVVRHAARKKEPAQLHAVPDQTIDLIEDLRRHLPVFESDAARDAYLTAAVRAVIAEHAAQHPAEEPVDTIAPAPPTSTDTPEAGTVITVVPAGQPGQTSRVCPPLSRPGTGTTGTLSRSVPTCPAGPFDRDNRDIVPRCPAPRGRFERRLLRAI